MTSALETDYGSSAETQLRDVTSLLSPRSVVLVGASDRRPAVFRNVFSSPIAAWAVNPGRTEVGGRPCFASVAALPEVPELAVLLVGHGRLLAAAAEAISAGVSALVVPGLGAEAGGEARKLAAALGELATQTGTAVLGPNCMGYARPGGLSPWIGSLPSSFRPGKVAVLAQSGSVAEGLVAGGDRVGFDVVVSSGGEVSRDVADFVGAFAKSGSTGAIGLFLETIRRPGALSVALVACAEAGIPVACVKAGRSATAARVALAHTGALVGSSQACSAYLSAHGVIEVDDLPDLVETLEVLGRRRRPGGRRVAAISESGGEAELFADHAEAAGLVLAPLRAELAGVLESEFPNYVHAENPLDAWAVDEASVVFPRSLELLAGSGDYDVVVAQVDLTQYRVHEADDWCEMIVSALAAATKARDVFPAVVSSQVNDPPAQIAALAREADVALLRGARTATRALAAAASWRPTRPEPAPAPSQISLAGLLTPGAMAEHESAQVLERYGIPFAPRRRAATPEDAAAAATALGFPVVVKWDGPAHKSARGGVVLGLSSPGEVEAAARRLGGPVLVAAQVPAGPEVICGMSRDEVFGPVLAVGPGGANAEESGRAAVALAPLGPVSAGALVDSVTAIAHVLSDGARRRLAEVLVQLSVLAFEHEEIEAVDINPLVVTGDDAVAVDALVVVRGEKGKRPCPS